MSCLSQGNSQSRSQQLEFGVGRSLDDQDKQVILNCTASARCNQDPKTRHSSTPTTVTYDSWLDQLQVFSHKGDLVINERGKKQVERVINQHGEKETITGYDKGWQNKKRDTNFTSTSVACILGEPSGVCVLDFDQTSLWEELMTEYADRCWPTVKTQRGYHVYFEYTDQTKEAFDSWPANIGKKETDGGIDIKRNGQIWFPGCRVKQRNGASFRYEWVLHDALPNAVGLLCQMPGDLIGTLTVKAAKLQKNEVAVERPKMPPAVVGMKRAHAETSPPLSLPSSCSGDRNDDQKIAALITGHHVLDNKTWYLIVCAMRNSQCTYEDAVALTTRYLQASGKSQTSRFERLKNGWDSDMANSKASIGTIIHHAKECNPAALSSLCRAEKKEFSTMDSNSTEHEGSDLFENGETAATDLKLAEKYLELQGDTLIYQQQVMYVYFQSRWRVDPNCELLKLVYMRTMTDFLAEMIRSANCRNDQSTIKRASKSICKCQTPKSVNGAVLAIKSLLAGQLKSVVFDVGAEQHYNIQFANCLYDMRTKKARPRNKSDYVTETLDYDFIPRENISEEIHADVRRFYEKLQPDKTQRTFQLGFLALSITGNTSHQIMKMNIGYSASNGKSTELKVHRACFGMYTTKLDKRTFNKNYEKRHKELLELIRRPIRLAFIEELDREKLDEDLIKDVVDGHELPVEILYGTKELARHQSKLMTCSNKDPNITADGGVKRRIVCQHYSSRFVDVVADNDESHVYKREFAFEERFEKPEYRNAYVHLLLEHVDSLQIPPSASELFSQIAEENDGFRNMLEEDYVVTGDIQDRVSRRDLAGYFRRKRVDWPEVLTNLKRLGLKYVRDERIRYDCDGTSISERGVIHGLKLICDLAEGEDVSRCHG